MATAEDKNNSADQKNDQQVEDQHTETQDQENPDSNQQNETSAVSDKDKEIEALKKEVEELKDKHIRLYSEFDNFRRRTSKEKLELSKTANEDLLLALLPVLDDFERAKKSMDSANDINALKEGVDLIHNKLFRTLENKGLKASESSVGQEFNSELQEAITQIPAPSDDLKGKVIDEIERGYYLHDKVIRFAKVIIGS